MCFFSSSCKEFPPLFFINKTHRFLIPSDGKNPAGIRIGNPLFHWRWESKLGKQNEYSIGNRVGMERFPLSDWNIFHLLCIYVCGFNYSFLLIFFNFSLFSCVYIYTHTNGFNYCLLLIFIT